MAIFIFLLVEWPVINLDKEYMVDLILKMYI